MGWVEGCVCLLYLLLRKGLGLKKEGLGNCICIIGAFAGVSPEFNFGFRIRV
jgi:hypothetical protein